MKASLRQKLSGLLQRLEEIDALLASPETAQNLSQLTQLSIERGEILPVYEAFNALELKEKELKSAELLLTDPDMRDLAEEEIRAIKEALPALEKKLESLLIPKDADDAKNVVLEIRAGTGGEESALFAGDLFRMYAHFADQKGWKVEVLSANESDLGGFKEIIARVIGKNAYGVLKFESGAHRVQRVPETETQGRVHTSAATVAILPEIEESEDIVLNPADLKIDTFRASGAGGQHIQKTDSAVRITHIPTGITAECQDGRSQHSNKASAMRVLAARINDKRKKEEFQKRAGLRKSLVGSGDRSERIRTYNFPQGRLTDHRINLTLYKLSDILNGDLDEITTALMNEYQAEQLALLEENA